MPDCDVPWDPSGTTDHECPFCGRSLGTADTAQSLPAHVRSGACEGLDWTDGNGGSPGA